MATDDITNVIARLRRLEIQQANLAEEIRGLRREIDGTYAAPEPISESEDDENNAVTVVDADGTAIGEGDRVFCVTRGRINCRYGYVQSIGDRFVTIRLDNGRETTRLPYNLRLQPH